GYKRHLGVHYGNVWRSLPSPLRGLTSSVVSRLPRNETLKRGVASLATNDQLKRYEDVFSLAPACTIANLFQPDQLVNGNSSLPAWREIFAQAKQTDELGAFQLLELRSSLPDELLMFADKLSMAHSLEGRVPYLDRTVVEFAQRLDANYKVRGGKGKWIHREVCRKYLPPKIVKRKKRGFAVNVVDSWFNSAVEGNLSSMLRDPESRMFEILRPERVGALLDAHESGAEDNHKLLFSLVMLEQWMRQSSRKPEPVLA